MEAIAKINTKYLSCVNCLEFPEMEVYDCPNGHAICDRCITSLINCTQCEVALGHKRQRNLLAESILDGALFPCKNNGCIATTIRNKLAAHRKKCSFRPVKLCSTFGFPDCQTVVTTGEQLRTHLLENHERVITLKTNRMCWPGLPGKSMKVNKSWNYFWSANEGEDPMFMTHSKITMNSSGEVQFSAVIIYLGESSQVSDSCLATLKFSMIYEGQTKYICSLNGPPAHFKAAEDPNTLIYLSIPINLLKKKMDSIEKEFTLNLDFAVELPVANKVKDQRSLAQTYSEFVNNQLTRVDNEITFDFGVSDLFLSHEGDGVFFVM